MSRGLVSATLRHASVASTCLPCLAKNLRWRPLRKGALIAIKRAEAPMTHVMKNAVRGNLGPAGIPANVGLKSIHLVGPQTRNEKRVSIPVSMNAATRG